MIIMNLSGVELQRSLLNLTHMLSVHHGSKVVILMEFKAVSVSEKDKLSELAEEALFQTEDKNDQRDLKDRGISNIVRYGIAFSGKNAEVRISCDWSG